MIFMHEHEHDTLGIDIGNIRRQGYDSGADVKG